MRVSLDWLSEFVDLPETRALVERFDMGGFEDTAVETPGPDLSALRVGHVVECGRHPNADRLSLCRVDVGDGEPIEVVCGAPNVAAGQKIAFAGTGTVLPDGTKLKRSKIRGVVSNGMICSSRELGLGDDHDGILVLAEDAPVGAPLPEVLAAGGRILEVGLTPNRGDTASLLGLAREVHALFGHEVRLPETRPEETGASAADAIRVRIDAPEDCHHYAARVVRGVTVGPSPDWVVRKLESAGIRAINNVVDVTNLVLMELGQPLHGFDLATLRGAEIVVRKARPGEKFAGLDGETRELDAADMVIADAERAIALAGVMGGAETEVSEATSDVLIESAHFHPTPVRLSARRYGLRTEASYRFERGVDREGTVRAADRAARLMAELAGGEVAAGVVEVTGNPPAIPGEICFEVARANRLLGTELSVGEIEALLGRVGVEARPEGEGTLLCGVPSHRNDLHVHQDLTEEVARVHGYEKIPTTEPVGVLQRVDAPPLWSLAERARDALAAVGLIELYSFPFVSEADLTSLRLPEGDPRLRALRVANPVKEEEPWLRTGLLPTLLGVARQNRSRQVDRVRVFEVSRVFRPQGPGELPQEPLELAVLVTAGDAPGLWEARQPPPLFFEVRGIAERLLNALGYDATFRRSAPPTLHPAAAVEIEIGGNVVGALGEIHPEVAARYELDVPCAVVELTLSALPSLGAREVRYREVSRHPRVRRDLAVVIDADQPAGDVLDAIRDTAGADLVSAELFDRYEGKGVPEGRVSLAFRLVFQRGDRTLTDAEVTRATERVVRMLGHRFRGELR